MAMHSLCHELGSKSSGASPVALDIRIDKYRVNVSEGLVSFVPQNASGDEVMFNRFACTWFRLDHEHTIECMKNCERATSYESMHAVCP
jgi:hypothetical protein